MKNKIGSMVKVGTSICLLLSLLLGNISCKSQRTSKKEKNTFYYRIPTEPPQLDPAKGVDTISFDLMVQLNEGLMMPDENLAPMPALAESYKLSSDRRTYTFTLRKGLKWSDGVGLTSKHFFDAWERILNPKTAAAYAYFLYDIEGAEDYNKGKLKNFSKVGIKAPDELTFEVRLKSPVSYWINLVTFPVAFPTRLDLIAKFGEKWIEPPNFPSSGPYQLIAWEHDKKLVMERNPHYWGKVPKIPRAIAFVIHENSTAVSLFEAGDLDLVRSLPTTDLERLQKWREYKETPYLRGYYYGFNVTKKPFDDVRVRRALACAIDRSVFPKTLRGGRIPMASWIPEGLLGFNLDIGLQLDLKRAKDLLSDAGYPGGKGFPKFSIAFDTREDNKLVAEQIQQMWKKELGLDVELTSQEWKMHLQQLHTDAPAVFRLGWGADFADPQTFMDIFLSGGGNNWTRWKNAEYDRLVREAGASGSVQERQKLYDKAQHLLLEEDAVIVPLFMETIQYLVDSRVKSFSIDRLGGMYLKRYELEQ